MKDIIIDGETYEVVPIFAKRELTDEEVVTKIQRYKMREFEIDHESEIINSNNIAFEMRQTGVITSKREPTEGGIVYSSMCYVLKKKGL